MIKKFFIFKKYVLILLLFLSTSKVYSEQIKNIVINGNQRVANETIIMFSNLEIGLDINQNLLNESLKELYKTNYFSDVKIINNNGEVIIEVKENPIIQSIIINGIKKDKIYETVEEITLKIEKYPFIESKINEQVNLLKNILKSYGYYFVKLNTSIEINENNTINLVYNFDLGEIAKIQKIKFIGNKIFRDST